MTTRTGILHIISGESRVGTLLLARCNAENPLPAATTFLRNRDLRDGDKITVTGEMGQFGEMSVLCMTAASAA
jgi:hypothetical protein